jgi:anaerobic selenocysteine-containing dehydrogenase
MTRFSALVDLASSAAFAVNGNSRIEAMTVWEMYKVHLRDYDLDTVADISGAPRDLIEELARDFGRRFWDPDRKT